MDIDSSDSLAAPSEEVSLSYDDTVPYAEQGPVPPTQPLESSLASRIGHTKDYLISDATATRAGKVRGKSVFAAALADLTR